MMAARLARRRWLWRSSTPSRLASSPSFSIARWVSRASVGCAIAFSWTVVSIATRSRSLVSIAPVRWATERLSCNSAEICSSPSRWRQRVSDERINRFRILHGRLFSPRRSRPPHLDQIGSNPQLRRLGRYIAALDQLGVPLDHFKRRLLALDPEPDVYLMLADAKIAHRQIRQPSRKRRVDIELIARGIREKSQQGLSQHEDGARRPRLGHIRPQILNREIRLGALGRGVKFRQLIEQEMACRHAHVVRDPRRLRAKAIEFEPHGDEGVVVRPHRAGLIIVR